MSLKSALNWTVLIATVVSIIATVAVRFAANDAFQTRAIDELVDIKADVRALEERVSKLEREKETAEKIERIGIRLTVLEERLMARRR